MFTYMTSDGVKIALVEDDLNLQNMYKLKLEIEGFTVKTAGDGNQGLQLCAAFQPDLLLLDLRMPIMDGEKMLTRLRQTEAGSRIRVIVLTNISRNEAPQSLRFLSVDRYIVKAHSTPAQVVDVIREVLSLS